MRNTEEKQAILDQHFEMGLCVCVCVINGALSHASCVTSAQTYSPSPAGTPCAGRWRWWRRLWRPQKGAGRSRRGCGGPPAEPSGGSTRPWSDLCEGLEQENDGVSKERKRGNQKVKVTDEEVKGKGISR